MYHEIPTNLGLFASHLKGHDTKYSQLIWFYPKLSETTYMQYSPEVV